METIKGSGYEITSDTAMFLNEVARRQPDGTWEFSEITASTIWGKTVADVYDDFQKKMMDYQEWKKDISKISHITCSPYHAIALYANGIITDKMFALMEQPVEKRYGAAETDGQMPVVCFAKQEITFNGQKFHASIVIFPLLMRLHVHMVGK